MSFPVTIGNRVLSGLAERSEVVPAMDENEFKAFYERTARPLWAYLTRITGQPQQVDDIVQETYYRFLRASTTYESESHRRNSLFQIATNIVRDAARKSSRRQPSIPISEEGVREDWLQGREPRADRQTEIRADLTKAMEQLEPVQRQMLWLAYAQGASHEEIAQILGLRAVSIRTTLLRARRKLAGILEAAGHRRTDHA